MITIIFLFDNTRQSYGAMHQKVLNKLLRKCYEEIKKQGSVVKNNDLSLQGIMIKMHAINLGNTIKITCFCKN